MATDGFIYEALSQELIEKINNAPGFTKERKVCSRHYSEIITLLKRDIGSAQLVFGRDIDMPFGTQYQNKSTATEKKHFDYLVSLVVDGPNTHQPGYRKSVEKDMLDYLEIKKEDVEYVGIFSGNRWILVTDFND